MRPMCHLFHGWWVVLPEVAVPCWRVQQSEVKATSETEILHRWRPDSLRLLSCNTARAHELVLSTVVQSAHTEPCCYPQYVQVLDPLTSKSLKGYMFLQEHANCLILASLAVWKKGQVPQDTPISPLDSHLFREIQSTCLRPRIISAHKCKCT